MHSQGTQALLRAFPRSRQTGVALLTVDAIWAYLLVSNMDLGEFTSWRQWILVAIVVGYFLTLMFVDEFLAVRALGILALLAAEPLLEAAFLRPETSRLLVTAVAYAWATIGLFWVGMPYLLRDQINWVTRVPGRWKAAALGGLVYGAVVIFFALTQYGN